jgi:hypothetical protein
MDSDPMIDDEVGAHTRVTVLAYWKFESVSLHRRVCELWVPKRRSPRYRPFASGPEAAAQTPAHNFWSLQNAAKRLHTGKLSPGSEEDQNILICVKQVTHRGQCKRVYPPVVALAPPSGKAVASDPCNMAC